MNVCLKKVRSREYTEESDENIISIGLVCSARKLYKTFHLIMFKEIDCFYWHYFDKFIIMTKLLSFQKEQCTDDVKGLPDTNIEFNDNEVDHNPTKKKTNKYLKVGKMAWQALKFARKNFPALAEDLVNE